MPENARPYCPECEEHVEPVPPLDRRNFIRVLGGGAAALLTLGGTAGLPRARAADAVPAERSTKPAEDLVKELHASLSREQKEKLVLPWDHKTGGRLTRLGMYNAPLERKAVGDNYTKPQQELIERTLRAIASDEDGYSKITRNGTFANSGSLQGCGAVIFGDPSSKDKYAWVFTGHHLTVRCDGNSEEGAAFGGPLYYGHSPNGYSDKNCFFYQTKSVLSVFDVLSEEQRKKAVLKGTPGEQAESVKFRPATEAKPGVGFDDLSKDQLKLVERVMRDVLSPFRKEDADEVMDILKANGGLEKIHLAFYQDMGMNDKQPWHFWRLEGPGFVWNYRVLPHVHTYVNISSKV